MFTQLLNTDHQARRHVQPPAVPLDKLASRLVTINVTSSINSLLDRMMVHIDHDNYINALFLVFLYISL